jgi:hypothetical protein
MTALAASAKIDAMTLSADHPSRKFAPFLQELAEGRVSCDDWLAWWQSHWDELQRSLLPGWYARLRPSSAKRTPNDTMAAAIAGASYILTALQIDHSPDQRFAEAAQAEHAAAIAAIQRQNQERQRTFQPAIKAIGAVFPKFGRLLARRSDLIVELQPGATSEQLQALERSLSLALPARLKALLLISRRIQLEHFNLGSLFFHRQRGDYRGPSDGMLCFADYFLEADGD